MTKIVSLSFGINLNEAGEVIKNGGVVVYPTETLYGLGADALNEGAVREVCEMKGRAPDMPIPVIVADREMLDDLVLKVGETARRLIEVFWPGPLTIVFDAVESLPSELVASTCSIGVRIPDSEVAIELVRAAGRPLTATSANASGAEPPATVREILDQLKKEPAMVLDAGTLLPSPPSTVVDARKGRIRILRHGAIPEKAIVDAIGNRRELN